MEDHPKRQAKKNIRKARKNKLQRLVGDTAIPAKPSPPSSASILDVKPEDDSQDAADEEWMFNDYKSELDAQTPKQEEEENYAELNALFHGQHEADMHGNTSTSPSQQHQGLSIQEHGPPWEEHHNNGTYQHGPHGLQCGRQHSSALSPTMLKSESHTMVDDVGQMYVPYEDMDVYMHNDSSLRHLYHTSSHMHPTS